VNPVYVTLHAKEMWMARVDGKTSIRTAGEAIEVMLHAGQWSARPKRWTLYRESPGTLFVSWHERPGVMLVVKDDTVLTTLSRQDPLTKMRHEVATARRRYKNHRWSRRPVDALEGE
jgi:hypothetical protein